MFLRAKVLFVGAIDSTKNLWTFGIRLFNQASLRQLLATFPTGTSTLRGRRSSEDSEMFIHAPCLLLWREVLDALAKPAELLVFSPAWRGLSSIFFSAAGTDWPSRAVASVARPEGD